MPDATRCDQHLGVVKDLAKLQSEVEHMNKAISESVALQHEQSAKLDEIKAGMRSPEISKAWILGALSFVGGVFGVTGAVIVALITNVDKISKLLGWG